jgi:hypothetical protein
MNSILYIAVPIIGMIATLYLNLMLPRWTIINVRYTSTQYLCGHHLEYTYLTRSCVRRDLHLATINPILVGYIYCQGMSFAKPIYPQNTNLYLILVKIYLIRILCESTAQRCVKTASTRCVFKIYNLTRLKMV